MYHASVSVTQDNEDGTRERLGAQNFSDDSLDILGTCVDQFIVGHIPDDVPEMLTESNPPPHGDRADVVTQPEGDDDATEVIDEE